MKKKIFGVKLSTIIQFLLCLIFAFAIWLSVQYSALSEQTENNDSARSDETSYAVGDAPFYEV